MLIFSLFHECCKLKTKENKYNILIAHLFFLLIYLQREINEVLEQRKLSEAAVSPSSLHDSNDIIRNKTVNSIDYRRNGIDVNAKHDSLREAHCRLNAKIIRNANSLTAGPLSPNHGSNIRKTNEWADSILKDLDTLILSNKRYTASLSNSITTSNATTNVNAVDQPPKSSQKRSTIINVVLRKTTPSTSPTSPTAPTAFASTPTNNLNKNQTVIINNSTAAITTKDNNKIPKPEKHVSGFGFSLLIFLFFRFFLFIYWIFAILLTIFSAVCCCYLSSFVFRHHALQIPLIVTSVTSFFSHVRNLTSHNFRNPSLLSLREKFIEERENFHCAPEHTITLIITRAAQTKDERLINTIIMILLQLFVLLFHFGVRLISQQPLFSCFFVRTVYRIVSFSIEVFYAIWTYAHFKYN